MTTVGWQKLSLRRLATCLDYLRVPLNAGERADRPGPVPYWGANTVQGYVDEALVQGPVVLVGEDGAPFFERDRPVAFYVNEPIWPNNHIHVLRPNAGVHGPWLAYALNDVDYSLHITGATRDKLTQSALMEIPVLTPPVEQQRLVADYLDAETARIDHLIAKQQELIETLRERRAAALDEAVSRVSAAPRVRLRYLFIPSAECNHPNEEVLSVYREYGVIPKSSRADNFNRTPENVERYLLVRPGDLVVNRMKAWQGSLGISSYWGIVSGDYEVLRPASDRLLGEFAHAYLRSKRMIGEYGVRSTGIRPAQWRLYWDQMGDIEIPVPAKEDQATVVHLVNEQTAEVDLLLSKTERFIDLARERRAALITAAVTGQIDVRGAA